MNVSGNLNKWAPSVKVKDEWIDVTTSVVDGKIGLSMTKRTKDRIAGGTIGTTIGIMTTRILSEDTEPSRRI